MHQQHNNTNTDINTNININTNISLNTNATEKKM